MLIGNQMMSVVQGSIPSFIYCLCGMLLLSTCPPDTLFLQVHKQKWYFSVNKCENVELCSVFPGWAKNKEAPEDDLMLSCYNSLVVYLNTKLALGQRAKSEKKKMVYRNLDTSSSLYVPIYTPEGFPGEQMGWISQSSTGRLWNLTRSSPTAQNITPHF